MSLSIYRNRCVENNTKFKLSKIEKSHGYGIVNVKAVVEKYHDKIRYKQKIEDYLTCEVILMKNSRQKKAIHDRSIEKKYKISYIFSKQAVIRNGECND